LFPILYQLNAFVWGEQVVVHGCDSLRFISVDTLSIRAIVTFGDEWPFFFDVVVLSSIYNVSLVLSFHSILAYLLAICGFCIDDVFA
jgi:hypothetical protein